MVRGQGTGYRVWGPVGAGTGYGVPNANMVESLTWIRAQGFGLQDEDFRLGVGQSRAAHESQSRPDSGLVFQVKVLTTF